jgi:predicted nucleic acid-binding protein
MSLGGPHQTPPVVLDTNVLVAGACRHAGSRAYEVLLGVLQRHVPLMLTEAISFEYLDVLQRPRVLAVTGLTLEQTALLVTDLIALSHEVQINFAWRSNLLDEGDSKFVEAAIHAGATIVTYNERDHLASDLARFGYSAMSPSEFTKRYL